MIGGVGVPGEPCPLTLPHRITIPHMAISIPFLIVFHLKVPENLEGEFMHCELKVCEFISLLKFSAMKLLPILIH